METKTNYKNFTKSTLYIHLNLELALLGDIKTSKEEEEKHLKNIREIKKTIITKN